MIHNHPDQPDGRSEIWFGDRYLIPQWERSEEASAMHANIESMSLTWHASLFASIASTRLWGSCGGIQRCFEDFKRRMVRAITFFESI